MMVVDFVAPIADMHTVYLTSSSTLAQLLLQSVRYHDTLLCIQCGPYPYSIRPLLIPVNGAWRVDYARFWRQRPNFGCTDRFGPSRNSSSSNPMSSPNSCSNSCSRVLSRLTLRSPRPLSFAGLALLARPAACPGLRFGAGAVVVTRCLQEW